MACGSLLGIGEIDGPAETSTSETGAPDAGVDRAAPVVDAAVDTSPTETGPAAKTVFVTTATFNGGVNGPSGVGPGGTA